MYKEKGGGRSGLPIWIEADRGKKEKEKRETEEENAATGGRDSREGE